MLKNYLVHKRNTSQSIKMEGKPKSGSGERLHKGSKQSKNKSNTLSLIEKSSKRIPSKHTVVEQLDQSDQISSPFFAFGQGIGTNKNWHIDVDKITEVQDSNSKREYTSHRSARGPSNCSKENYNTSNFDEALRKSTKSRSNKQKSKQGEREKERSNKSRNEKTKSTISLSRVKNTKDLEYRTQKMEKSVKMLWECMGELWENSRVSQYKSEKNNEGICGLKRILEEQEQKILQIKFELSRNAKNSERVQPGVLRG